MKNKFLRYYPAVISAFILTLASPGQNLWFLAFVAYIPVLIAADRDEKPGWILWFSGFLYFAYNLRWVETSVSHFGGAPAFVGYFVTAFFGAFLGLFWALFGRVYKKKTGACLLSALVFVCLEIVRSTILGGFPWLLLAHTQYTSPITVQIADLGGEALVSFVIIYFNLAAAEFYLRKNPKPFAIAAAMLIFTFVYGAVGTKKSYGDKTIKARIIQPNYSQTDKWDPDKDFSIYFKVNEMVRNSYFDRYDLLMLPESVYPHFMNDTFSGYILLGAVSEVTPVIAGGIHMDGDEGNHQFFNSVFMFDKGKPSVYDKRHLVPFGEYFPLGGIFKPIDYYFFKGAQDFSSGNEPTVFHSGHFNAAPLVCYESAYSSLVKPQVEAGADIITVVTNDSWFGHTQGPYQHLAAEVLRAAEFHRGVLRAAQTGVSACVEPNAKIKAELGIGKTGYLDCGVTLSDVKTVYSGAGYTWLIILTLFAFARDRRRRQ